MPQLTFSKMHGLGNDFMVVDMLTQHIDLTPQLIRHLSDRHTGVGFDQLLVVEPPGDPEADFRYRIYNADGSEAEQCGNGARCFARFVVLRGLSQKQQLRLQTSTGCITTRLFDDGLVEVDMGPPIFAAAKIPLNESVTSGRQADGSYSIEVDDETLQIYPVSMGNPHAVVFVDNIADAPVQVLGPKIGQHPAFPQGANVGFCQIVDEGFARLRVFERGVGETRACGTGACAAAVTAQQAGLLREKVKISLPGGKVRINWLGNTSSVRMIGNACFVYEGNLNI